MAAGHKSFIIWCATMEKKISKFQIGDLLPIGITFVVLGIAITYGIKVMGDVKGTIAQDFCSARTDSYTVYNSASSTALCYNSTGSSVSIDSGAYNASVDGIDAVAKIPSNLPTIVTVVLASIIIGILVTYMIVRNK